MSALDEYYSKDSKVDNAAKAIVQRIVWELYDKVVGGDLIYRLVSKMLSGFITKLVGPRPQENA